MAKQRTQVGSYSDEFFGGKDKIRNVSWGPYEGNKTPRPIHMDTDKQTKAADGPSLIGYHRRGGWSSPIND